MLSEQRRRLLDAGRGEALEHLADLSVHQRAPRDAEAVVNDVPEERMRESIFPEGTRNRRDELALDPEVERCREIVERASARTLQHCDLEFSTDHGRGREQRAGLVG